MDDIILELQSALEIAGLGGLFLGRVGSLLLVTNLVL